MLTADFISPFSFGSVWPAGVTGMTGCVGLVIIGIDDDRGHVWFISPLRRGQFSGWQYFHLRQLIFIVLTTFVDAE